MGVRRFIPPKMQSGRVGVGSGDAAWSQTILDSGPLVGRVRVERRFGPSSSIITYELRADSAQLEVHVELDWYTRKNDHPRRKRQGAELASRPSFIVLISMD